MLLLPVIAPGCAGKGDTVTARDLAVPDPHKLFAVTITFPFTLPIIALIVVVVEVPVDPVGRVHV
jgi:hypothetical protein